MRDHYQVNASTSVLSFMLHQSDYTVECEDKKIATHCEDNLNEMWTQTKPGHLDRDLGRLRAQRFAVGERPHLDEGHADQDQGPDSRRISR
jgi:hypothetical protein